VIRINCLNALGKIYQQIQTDSALFYSYLALNEAQAKQYTKGKADASFIIAISYAERGDYKSAEQNYRLSISNYEKLSNLDALGWAYLWFGVTLYVQANFQSATKAFIKADELFKKTKNIQGSNQILLYLALNYEESGFYEKAFDLCTKSLNDAKENYNKTFLFYSLLGMGRLYLNVEDYQTALDYYQQANSLAEKLRLQSQICTIVAKFYIGEAYGCMGNLDSSKFYFNQVLTFYKTSPKDSSLLKVSIMMVTESFGELYLRQKDYDKALAHFSSPMKFFLWGNNRVFLMKVLLATVIAYEGKKEYNVALAYARRLLLMAKETGAKKYILYGTNLLWNVYDKMGVVDSAYYYYRQYADMKDSLLNTRHVRQVTLFKEKSENEKEQLQLQLTLQKESLNKKIAVGVLFIVMLLAFIVLRIMILKRKNERHRRELAENELQLQKLKNQKQLSELEMQSLHAQMDHLQKLQETRTQIAADLHDDIGSTLTSISYYSELVKMQLKEDNGSLKPFLDKIGNSAKNTVSAMSDIVWIINPQNDTTTNLINRMKRYASEMLGERNIQYSFNTNEEIEKLKLNMEQRKNLYLIYKEAVHNAVKYSQCSKIEIDFTGTNHEIRLSINDNGKGFDILNANEGNGLTHMKKRAEEIKAQFEICSAQNKGTHIQLICKFTRIGD
jgi:two-component system, NarL family, sensor histidine kinase UhpB